MNEVMTGPPSDYGALIIAMVAAVGVLAGVVRAYLTHRTRLHAEREASARVAARATGLMGLAERHRGVVRIVERDRDGHREVEFGDRAALLADDGEEAA